MPKVKVLTIKQPWAQLVLTKDAKQFETRGWETKHRGELFIHASMNFLFSDLEMCRNDRFFKFYIPDPTKLVTGAIIGKVKLVDCIPTTETGFTQSLSKQEKAFGDFKPGRFAWLLAEPELIEPIDCVGKLGIWEYEMKEVSHA